VVLLMGGELAHAEPIGGPARAVVSITGRLAAFVEEASERFGIPVSWIRAVMGIESGGKAHAQSPKGAMGLMQIMPQTWSALRLRYGLGGDPYDARDNILAGSAYLRELWDRYGTPGFLAAYNAGPARYEDHLTKGRPLPTETRAYVAKLAPLTAGGAIDGATLVASMVRSWTEAPLFTGHGDRSPANSPVAPDLQGARPQAVAAKAHSAMFAGQSDALFVGASGRISQP
jgi:membrane-bound lytic murein transglycosylase B